MNASLKGLAWGDDRRWRLRMLRHKQSGKPLSWRSQREEAFAICNSGAVLISVGGSNLAKPPEAIAREISKKFVALIGGRMGSPYECFNMFLTSLEREIKDGAYRGALVCLASLIFIEDGLWCWRVGGNAVWHGRTEAMQAVGDDHTDYSLREQGIIPKLPLRFEETSYTEHMMASFVIGMPERYESELLVQSASPFVMAFNQSAVPFETGDDPRSLSELLSADAGYRHGFEGMAIAISEAGNVEPAMDPSWEET